MPDLNLPPLAPDERIVYGFRCTWWDSISQAVPRGGEAGGLPVCPYCGSPLLESPSLEVWLDGARAHEVDGHPGYVDFLLWLRGRGCWREPGRLERALAAYARDLEADADAERRRVERVARFPRDKLLELFGEYGLPRGDEDCAPVASAILAKLDAIELEEGPLLGLATTRELLAELKARLEDNADAVPSFLAFAAELGLERLDDIELDYRTAGS